MPVGWRVANAVVQGNRVDQVGTSAPVGPERVRLTGTEPRSRRHGAVVRLSADPSLIQRDTPTLDRTRSSPQVSWQREPADRSEGWDQRLWWTRLPPIPPSDHCRGHLDPSLLVRHAAKSAG